jgi:hypothetical protein
MARGYEHMIDKYERIKGENFIRTYYKNDQGLDVIQWVEYMVDSDGVIYLIKNDRWDDKRLDYLNKIMPMYAENIAEVKE